MLSPIPSLIVYLTEMLISYIFFTNVAERRFGIGKCLGLGCSLFAAGAVLNLLYGNYAVINALVTFVMNLAFALCCFELKPRVGVFYGVILVAVGGASEFVSISAISALSGHSFFAFNANLSLLILECSISKLLYFCTVLVLARAVRAKSQAGTFPVNFFLYPIAVIVCFSIFWYICDQPETSYAVQSLLSIASIVLLVSTVLLFVTYQHQVERDRHTLQMESELAALETEKTYYDILEQQNQALMAYAHDAKNHLAAISALNTDPRINGYIQSLSRQLADYSRNCHSGNKMLDVMIHKFSVECEMQGVDFTYDVKLCNLGQIADMDLVAILGNLFDNALAAAEASLEKVVSFATASRNGYSVLILSNSCDTAPRSEGNRLSSTKTDHKHHGYGMKNVARALKKYRGDLCWEYDEGRSVFTVTAMVEDKDAVAATGK